MSTVQLSNRTNTLQSRAFEPLPLTQIQPTGWLKQQLRIQADGLSGHLDEFWPDVARSRWIGGDAEGWERGPYWLDGMVPLAYLLDDARLKAKVQHWVDEMLTRQSEDGWLGPVLDARYSYEHDPWPRFIVLKAFSQYHDATQDARILVAMQRFFRRVDTLLDDRMLRSWAFYRWADLVLSIQWLYERRPEPWLLALAEKVKSRGFDWSEHFQRFPYLWRSRHEECDLRSHGPNNSMAIKTPGVWFRHSGEARDREMASHMIAELDRYHGQATGMFSCDEHLAGTNPSQGSELCGVVEYMFSLEVLLSILGDPAHADRLESLAYNALPATISPDMWSHQYDQQVNQVVCRVDRNRPWTSNNADANIYGLEPHFGCCTANMHQGWPKFASHLWMRSPDGGLAAMAWAPCTVVTELQGQPVRILVETNYPFNGEIRLTVQTETPIAFPLHLRVPGWAQGAELQVTGEAAVHPAAGAFYTVQRTWSGADSLVLHLPMEPRFQRGPNQSLSIHRGPLLYALEMGEEWRQIAGELPHADWEVHPTTPWNYALQLDESSPADAVRFEESPVGDAPFSPKGAPVRARVQGRQLPEWTLSHPNAAALVPPSPVQSAEPLEELTLIPFGSTNLRVAVFPVLAAQK